MAGEIRRIWQRIGTALFGGDVVVGNGQTTSSLYFGGTTSTHAKFQRSGTTLVAMKGDSSAYADMQARTYAAFTPSGGYLHYGNYGNVLSVVLVEELLTVAAATTTDTALDLPAGAIILAVSCRVTTVIPTATSFVLAGASAGGPFTGSVSVAATSTDVGTLNCPYRNASAQKVRLTITGSDPANNTGRVRVSMFYIASTAPTS